MADDLADSFNPSLTTLLNRLPTKRIDAAITRARETPLPGPGEQTGGYDPNYNHLSHLPLFPLYSAKQDTIHANAAKRKERLMNDMDRTDPDKLMTGAQKLGLNLMSHVSGGANVVSVKRWERRLVGSNIVSQKMVTDQDKLIIFTRWIVAGTPTPASDGKGNGKTFLIDVLEHRFLDPTSKMAKFSRNANAVHVKIGVSKDKKVTLKLLQTEAKGIKGQKGWSKGGLNSEHCEGIVVVEEGGKESAMEMVARIQRTANSLEAHEMLKRFDKEWVVPEV